MRAILPWGPWHDRLHRELLAEPQLLPRGERLLLAVSGGADSMALTGLLLDLRRRHGWDLHLWHGDHGWHPDAGRIAGELAAWAAQADLPIAVSAASPPPDGEEAARRWRYASLERQARERGCGRVLTGHTGSDRAETLLFNLARGSDLAGLSSLRRCRPLNAAAAGPDPILLIRPLLSLDRDETAAFCRERGLPVWSDPGNADERFHRNRIRLTVLPVLEGMHPGASRRISALAERLQDLHEPMVELLTLALDPLAEPGPPAGLRRRPLTRLAPRTQELLLRHWLEREASLRPGATVLAELRRRLQPWRGPGSLTLRGGWRLDWERETLHLVPSEVSRLGGLHNRTPSHQLGDGKQLR